MQYGCLFELDGILFIAIFVMVLNLVRSARVKTGIKFLLVLKNYSKKFQNFSKIILRKVLGHCSSFIEKFNAMKRFK